MPSLAPSKLKALTESRQPPTLFDEPEGQADTHCWMAINPYSHVVHAILVPWPTSRQARYRSDGAIYFLEHRNTLCPGRAVDTAGWQVWWGDRRHWLTCAFCKRVPPPLHGLIPEGWPHFQRPEDCLVAADFWEDAGEQAKADLLRRFSDTSQ